MLLTEFDEEKDWAIMAKGYKEIGYEEGRKNNIKEIIKNMLLKGKTKAEIIDLTGITNEEYEDSVNQISN